METVFICFWILAGLLYFPIFWAVLMGQSSSPSTFSGTTCETMALATRG